MIQNVMIIGSCIEPGDAQALWEDEPFELMSAENLPDLLVQCGIYASRSEARRAGRDGPIPPGWTMFRASKKVPVFCIWNPTAPLSAYGDA